MFIHPNSKILIGGYCFQGKGITLKDKGRSTLGFGSKNEAYLVGLMHISHILYWE